MSKNIIKDQLISMGFNKDSLRLLLDGETIKKIPIRHCTEDELYKAKESWFYNPVHYYCDLITPEKGECGHDDKFRYILNE